MARVKTTLEGVSRGVDPSQEVNPNMTEDNPSPIKHRKSQQRNWTTHYVGHVKNWANPLNMTSRVAIGPKKPTSRETMTGMFHNPKEVAKEDRPTM